MGLEIIVLLVDASRLKLTLDLAWNTLYDGLEKRTLRNTRPVQDSRLKVLFDIDVEAEFAVTFVPFIQTVRFPPDLLATK